MFTFHKRVAQSKNLGIHVRHKFKNSTFSYKGQSRDLNTHVFVGKEAWFGVQGPK